MIYGQQRSENINGYAAPTQTMFIDCSKMLKEMGKKKEIEG